MRLNFTVSRWEVLALSACHILVAYPVWYAGWPITLSLLLTAVVAGHAWFQLFRSLQLLDRSLITLQLLPRGKALLITRGGVLQATLGGAPFFCSIYMLLHFKVLQGERLGGPRGSIGEVRPQSRRDKQLARKWLCLTGRRFSGKNYRVLVTVGTLSLQQRKLLASHLRFRDRPAVLRNGDCVSPQIR